MNKLDVGLLLFDFSRRTDALDRVLRPIAAAIGETATYFESLTEDEAEFRMDDELDAIESLLGCAFVMCQTHMNGIVSRLDALDRRLRNDASSGETLLEAGATRHAFLKIGCRKKIGEYTDMQFLWSLANYFKHRDEWVRNWDKATGQTKNTIDVITAAGLSQGSTGNLRTGAEALGVDKYSNLDVLIDSIAYWSDELDTEVRRKLGRSRTKSVNR